MTEEAVQMIEEEGLDQPVIVVARPGWNPGVVGIVASKLVERFYRPAIVLGVDEEKGIAKGSARSIKGFDLFQNLSECRDILPLRRPPDGSRNDAQPGRRFGSEGENQPSG